MTEIGLNPQEAAGTMAKLAGQFDSAGSTLPQAGPAGLDARVADAVGDQVTSSQQALTDAGTTSQTGRSASDGLGAQDGTNAQRTGGLDTNLKDGALGRKGGLGPGGLGREGPRLSAADLAKLVGAGSYDSPMPTTQTAPNLPQLPSIPTQALTAPTQSMLGSAGAISPLLNELLQRAATNPLGDGGPASQAMGAALPGQGGRVQELVRATLGVPYAWGGGDVGGPTRGISDGGGPADRAGDYNKVGFDCSGYAKYITYQLTGHVIPHSSQAQYAQGIAISPSQAQPGDLFFPASAGRPPEHVQVYIGNSQVAEAPSSGQTVKISPLQPGEFRRMVA
ncbi:C40 family peptidase [Mycobacterium timonense]|uniref:C40 family peptidase n=2 Tax=Mycobacterium avium complex (MAC) TaxID=120793 RepID=A0AAW5S090_MYCBC|nr:MULTISPECIES: C40 family peptidase [Mycobacterium avium complex (MAC)]MCV6988116.1 C40 family peptidase [Mycobacterium bouchedurhonense]MCV6995018.1 C40 family peptidase [Mycobacterium timonense]MDV3306320.1 C40 family peptidase [Mycobacterium avium subsp. hominissuis]ORA42224.1 hypothetical protein BST19_25800 [Mycobacterium bouchedurhonense]ORB77684.1 hypothetical protein BST46_23170 [Mycobacterium timonense]